MKQLITFFILILMTNCYSQDFFEINNEAYYSKIFFDGQKTNLNVKRAVDSIDVSLNIKNNFIEFINIYYDKKNTNQILLSIKRLNNIFYINQLVFINNNDKIIIHKGSEDIYGKLDKFEIEIIECQNCQEELLIPIYRKVSNDCYGTD